ncbi:MAG: GNAT family N-acetyltransferase [Nitrospirota bacterium]|nr:GNAT family N-acetyltransferase [Nitrospirota bacterium]
MDIRVAPVLDEEIPLLLDLQKKSFDAHSSLFDTSVWSRETPDALRAELGETTVLVARDPAGRIHGSVRGRDVEGVWVVRKLFVDPSAQKTGVGKALMRAIEERRPPSCHKISLCTMLVLGENVRFFLALGYQPEYLMPDHYNRLHLLCFRK